MVVDKPTVEVTCCVTGAAGKAPILKDGSPGVPYGGWHALAGQFYSPAGWAETFAARGVRLPVASVVEGFDPPDWSVERRRLGWSAFRAAMRAGRRETMQIANALLSELNRIDCLPLIAGVTKDGKPCRKLPKLSLSANDALKRLYALGREQFPDFDSQSLGAIRRRVWARYHDRTRGRFQQRVLGEVSLPTFTSLPVPICSKDYSVWFNDQNQPFVRFRLNGLKFTVRLRNTPDRKHYTVYSQLQNLHLALNGQAKLGELSLGERSVGSSHYNGGAERVRSGGKRRQTEYTATFALWLPKRKIERTETTVIVRTQKDKLWSVWVGDRQEPWDLNDDQVRQLVIGRAARLFRLSQDAKMERRRPKSAGAGLADVRRTVSGWYERRLEDTCRKQAALLGGLVTRVKAGKVVLDFREKSFCPGFPYSKLQTDCKHTVEFLGVSVEVIGDSEEETRAEVLD